MPRRKATKKKYTEDDQRAEKLEAFLKQFDMEVDRRVYEMHRATEQACAHIDSMFKLARLKIPSAMREEIWESDKRSPAADQTLSAVDAVLSEAEQAVQQQQQKPAGRPRGRGRVRATPTSTGLVTPLQPLKPLHASTPAITPKFDPQTIQRRPPSTIRRHRPKEVLMSLKGSPVLLPEAAAAPEPVVETKQLLLQTKEVLQQDEALEDLDDETIKLVASLRAQLNDMAVNANVAI